MYILFKLFFVKVFLNPPITALKLVGTVNSTITLLFSQRTTKAINDGNSISKLSYIIISGQLEYIIIYETIALQNTIIILIPAA